MVDKSHIDILQVCQRYTSLKRNSSYNGGQWVGPCPICADGGEDRFHVWPKKGDGMYWCRQCDEGGDVIKFIQRVENVGFKDACDRLGIQLDERPPQPARLPRHTPPQPETPKPGRLRTDYAAYDPEWQEQAQAFIWQSRERLWNEPDALAYLTDQRHLTEPVIVASELGFNPVEQWATWAGVKVWLPRGIVIPWIDYQPGTPLGNVWRVRFRCLDDAFNHFTPKNGMKYPQTKGSANGLYFGGRSSNITGTDTVVLVEGEFDALVIHAQARYGLSAGLRAIATGGTTQARVTRWVDLLNQAGRVYLAFDSGETGGPLAALWWSSMLDNAERLIPTAHDVTDMVTEGHDLYEWLGMYPADYVTQKKQLSMFGEEPTTTANPYQEVI